jgi:rhomboid family GlyGly-CTERM serine protease
MRIGLPLLLVCAVLFLAPDSVGAWLSFDRQACFGGEVWRLWSGHLVHFSAAHAMADLAVLIAAAAIAEHEIGARRTAFVLFAGAPLISLGLALLLPDLAIYRGSSALSILLGSIGGALIWHRAPRMRPALWCIGAVVIVKIVIDAVGWLPGLSSVPDGIRVAWQAHAMAAILAAVYVAFCARRGA